jgi:hypothetical protein
LLGFREIYELREIYGLYAVYGYGLTSCERVYTPVPRPVPMLVPVLKAPETRNLCESYECHSAHAQSFPFQCKFHAPLCEIYANPLRCGAAGLRQDTKI